MRRLGGALATITLASTIALSAVSHAAPPDAGGGCPLIKILVSREGNAEEDSVGLICRRVGDIVGWLGVTPGVAVSNQPPQGELHESFTVTILLQHPLHTLVFRPILTETVYPLADGGPVALVRSRTIFHEFDPYPRWVVPAGWRTLNPTERLPAVLEVLGMPQPEFQPSPSTGETGQATESTESPASLSTVAAGPATEPRKPKPDLITLAFLLIVLATAALLVRRGVARSRKDAQERDATETRVGPGDV
jgi:hypothetical protein